MGLENREGRREGEDGEGEGNRGRNVDEMVKEGGRMEEGNTEGGREPEGRV